MGRYSWITCRSADGCYLVALTVAGKGAAHPTVAAEGTWGRDPSGTVKIGRYSVRIAGDEITDSDDGRYALRGTGGANTSPAPGAVKSAPSGREPPRDPGPDRKAALARLVEAVKAGKKPSFYVDSMRTKMTVTSATPDGKLRLSARGMMIAYDFDRLPEDSVEALAAALGN